MSKYRLVMDDGHVLTFSQSRYEPMGGLADNGESLDRCKGRFYSFIEELLPNGRTRFVRGSYVKYLKWDQAHGVDHSKELDEFFGC